MRLIDVDELIEIAKKNKAVNGALADLKDIKDIVNTATTIEIEPTKHSEWIDKEGWLVSVIIADITMMICSLKWMTILTTALTVVRRWRG